MDQEAAEAEAAEREERETEWLEGLEECYGKLVDLLKTLDAGVSMGPKTEELVAKVKTLCEIDDEEE